MYRSSAASAFGIAEVAGDVPQGVGHFSRLGYQPGIAFLAAS
jgi:hypothetical protein